MMNEVKKLKVTSQECSMGMKSQLYLHFPLQIVCLSIYPQLFFPLDEKVHFSLSWKVMTGKALLLLIFGLISSSLGYSDEDDEGDYLEDPFYRDRNKQVTASLEYFEEQDSLGKIKEMDRDICVSGRCLPFNYKKLELPSSNITHLNMSLVRK